MSRDVPRWRVIAGPNGSEKSTIKSLLRPEWVGSYVNPDEIEAGIRNEGHFDFRPFGIGATSSEILQSLLASKLLERSQLSSEIERLQVADDRIGFEGVEPNSYWASVISDIVRRKLLESEKSLTFETVMSSPDKIALMRLARSCGYRTYLYYVATNDPTINISRVRHRVKMGGHNVPEDKIVSRYARSMALLQDTITVTNRAFIFDNSGREAVLLAEVVDGRVVSSAEKIPDWFRLVLASSRVENLIPH